MPSPNHVDSSDKGWRNGDAQGDEKEVENAAGYRRGIALDVGDQSGSYLSPSRLLSNMGISNIRDYLPSQSPPAQAQAGPSSAVQEGYASWQESDLHDGQGRRPLLLLSTPSHVLQIFALPPSQLPSDPDVKERYRAPEEVVSIPTLVYASSGGRRDKVRPGNDRVVEARLVDDRSSTGRSTALLLLSGSAGKGGSSTYSLASLNLISGEVEKAVEIGTGTSASLSVSSKAVVVAFSHPTPSLHFFKPTTLEPIRPASIELSSNPHSTLPTSALSGRLLAYATSEPPQHVGKHGLGTLITSNSLSSPPARSRRTKDGNQAQSQQSVILNSAVGIGGGVAMGVWAGLKMGAQAASRATNGRMASSAPSRSTFLEEGVRAEGEEVESLSLDDTSILDDSPVSSTMPLSPSPSRPDTNAAKGGEWIKIVDLIGKRTIAHFKLPPSRHAVPNISQTRQYEVGHSSISHLAFSPDGTNLFASPVDGRSFHLFEIHPQPAAQAHGNGVEGEVWHLYEMRRGNTASQVVEVQWSGDGRWIGVATGRGTVHVFAINPSGGPATASSHTPPRLVNPSHLHSLSTTITPSVRLRMIHKNQPTTRTRTTFTFLPQRLDPLRPGISCLDIAIYRSTTSQLDLARLSVSAVQSVPRQQGARRGSGLTEMMKMKSGGIGDAVEIDSKVKVTWLLPSGQDLLLSSRHSNGYKHHVTRNLAYAEIQTFSCNPTLLPISIYLSHQVDFYDAKPIDDYSRLSILDPEARTRKLHYRPEVEIHPPTSSPSSSLKEPLVTAIHSVIESSPSSELPYLPNEPRYGGYSYGSWKSIPIQQVRDGMGNLKRDYVSRRSKKREEGMGLSFEDDAVFADEDGGGGSESSPMSSGIPTTEPELDMDGDEEWGIRWEDEYRKAVEEDGGPDDLILGLMDEQQEERRRWVEKQRGLARDFETEGGLRKQSIKNQNTKISERNQEGKQ